MILASPFQLRIVCDSVIYGKPQSMRWKRCYQTETKAISLWDISLSSLGSPCFILYPSNPAGPYCVHGSSPKPSGQVMGSYQKEVILLNKIIKNSPIYNVCRRNIMIPHMEEQRIHSDFSFLKVWRSSCMWLPGRTLAAKLLWVYETVRW